MNTKEILKTCVLFSDLDSQSISELAAIANAKSFESGAIIFSEGDESRSFYILSEGSLDLVKISPDGRERLARSVKKGEVFAEAAVFSGDSYPATAIARSACRIFAIEKHAFISLVRRNPEVSFKIMGVMARLLRHLNSLLADASLNSVSTRLAKYLIARSKETNSRAFDLGIKKQELAFHLGIVPETLSRTFKKFQTAGFVAVHGKWIKIKNIEGLRRVKEM